MKIIEPFVSIWNVCIEFITIPLYGTECHLFLWSIRNASSNARCVGMPHRKSTLINQSVTKINNNAAYIASCVSEFISSPLRSVEIRRATHNIWFGIYSYAMLILRFAITFHIHAQAHYERKFRLNLVICYESLTKSWHFTHKILQQ